MGGITEEGRKANIPESESRSKPKVEIFRKTAQETINILSKCGVPKRFLTVRIEDISPRLWTELQEFLKGESLFLHGPPGVGKTHMAAALMLAKVSEDNEKEIIYPDGFRARYLPRYPQMISVPDLLLEIRESFGGQAGESEGGLIQKYSTIGCAILDDLGVEKTSEWSLQTLYSIIDRRYREEKQTLITSNLTLDEIAEKVGDRIASRIAGMCKVVEIKGKDRRVKT